jgi:hypothetical protein
LYKKRFNRIQAEKIIEKPRQIVKQTRQASLEPCPQRDDSVLSVNGGGPIIERPRVFQRPTCGSISSNNKSFLHDNYMV